MSAPTLPHLSPERRDHLALTLVEHVGSRTHGKLRERFGSAERALDSHVAGAVAREVRALADAAIERAGAAGLRLILDGDAEYPEPLRELARPPRALWTLGSLEILQAPVVAIVGTRRPTPYGMRITRELAGAFSRAGACVVSGMALGIDGAAHREVLANGGRTVAVLGTGVDVAYPPSHRPLHSEIASKGLLISELLPGERSHAGSFPQRNRIIAGLAAVTIAVEAPHRSGALITLRAALDLQNRDVACVPGPIDSVQSQGTNEFIREGAQIITSIEDALALAGLTRPLRSSPLLDDPAQQRIWEALGTQAATLDELCARSRLPVHECLAAVTALELRGSIECALTGEIRKR